MNDDQLETALKSLPREQAGLGFTAGVLRRIDQPSLRFLPAYRAFRSSRIGAGVFNRHAINATIIVAAVLVLALGLGWREMRQHQAAEHLQVLLAEKQELEAELESLRRLTARARPVVYLGGNDEIDLVLDLARFQRQGGFGSKPSTATLPAPSYSRAAVLRGEQSARPLRVVY